MSAKHGTGYTMGFAAAVCLVCSVFVCLSAVALKDMQEENKKLDKQKNVLKAAGMLAADEDADAAKISELYKNIQPLVIDVKSGEVKKDVDAASINMRMAVSDNSKSFKAPANDAKVLRIPNEAVVYQVMEGEMPTMLIFPISGKGLWSTLYGFLAVDVDTTTVKGVSFYEHGETPGLGGEIENPKWTALWKDRKLFDQSFQPAFKVVKGIAGSPADAPHEVDGLSGATLTCKGVTALVNFWIGKDGFGPFLENFRKGGI
ncbi:MAG: Na(+)-translocating NADH-quinone reductase subunit C [Deltaproteobacteria bacterium]|nr:Na(+)-translocating NADH-quinone reductase subunit C [Deltaproteobacteria bacterium]MBN2674194.1 Na(+)-translocating NADH-quinone reductase subunit C [Deltaproteobacteria bacterium]